MPGSLSGRILIARPVLSEPSFYRSVIYLVEHDEELQAAKPPESTPETSAQ